MSRYFRLGHNLLIDSQKVANIKARNSSTSYTIEISYQNHWKQFGNLINRRGNEVLLKGHRPADYTFEYDTLAEVKEDLKMLESECLDAEIFNEIND